MPSSTARVPQLSEQQILDDLEYLRCADDFWYWLRHHGWIKDERSGRVVHGIELWPGQREYLEAIIAKAWVITGKSRQVGVSWLLRNYETWRMMFQDNISQAITAQDDPWAMKHLARVRWIYEKQPNHLRRAVPVVGQQNKHEFGLTNGSRIIAVPCTGGSLRGLSGSLVSCEELAFWPNADVAWAAIIGAVNDSGGQLVIASTANGEGGKYHEIWTNAEAGLNRFQTVFLPWSANPERDDLWYSETARELGPLMRQEYPATPDEMFLSTGTKYFDARDLKLLEAQHGMKPIRVMYGAFGLDDAVKLSGRHVGLRIYREPQPGRSYVIGADTADGGGDACSATVLDVQTGEQVAQYISYTDRSGQFGDALAAIGEQYNWAMIGAEINNTGHGTCVALERNNYPNLYRRANGENHWRTSDSTREPMLNQYREALSDRELTLHDPECYRQARIFCNVKGKWQHPENDHDDCVFAAGIAQQVRLQVLAQGQRSDAPAVYLGDKRIA